MSNYFISAGIELKQGASLKDAETGLRKLAEQTQSEPGCLLFEIRQNLKEPGRFTLWECWTDKEALADHFRAEHTRAYLAHDFTKVSYIEELIEIGQASAKPAA